MRLLFVHDWLWTMRGGERCLEALCELWPEAPVWTLFACRGRLSPLLQSRTLRTSWLNRLPAVAYYYRWLLPVLPAVVSSWRVPPVDVVVSLSHCVAKGVRVPRRTWHVCYCFTPMRYAWDLRDSYFPDRNLVLRRSRDMALGVLRAWDRYSSAHVDRFVAISATVQRRIAACYGRSSTVIYPPVDTDFYVPGRVRRDEYYLVVGALTPYKRVDLAVTACQKLGRYLLVIGDGPCLRRLQAQGAPYVTFAGWQPDPVIRYHLQRCRALLFPGEEDFGIVPVEANACGTPVIAYGRGGVTETQVPYGVDRPPTALFFHEQTPEALAEAILQFEKTTDAFDPRHSREQALRFQRRRFQREFQAYIAGLVSQGETGQRQAA
ncbi:MAG: glycosyltransferase family 4 protein [Gemmataceae bacterium]